MFVVKEKDRVYFVDTALCVASIYAKMTKKDCFDSENLHMYKVAGVKNCIFMGAPAMNEVDVCRYDVELNKVLRQSDFSLKSITYDVIPAIKKALCAYHGTDKYEWDNEFVLAKGNRAFIIMEEIVYEIEDYEILLGAMDELASANFEQTKNQPAIERIIECAKLIEKVQFGSVFPIAVMDTKTLKTTLYDKKGKKIKL